VGARPGRARKVVRNEGRALWRPWCGLAADCQQPDLLFACKVVREVLELSGKILMDQQDVPGIARPGARASALRGTHGWNRPASAHAAILADSQPLRIDGGAEAISPPW